MRRREFLMWSAIAGSMGWPAIAEQIAEGSKPQNALAWSPVAWLEFAASGAITLRVAKSEMGQGVMTAMGMLVAEELDVPMAQLTVELAPGAVAYRDARGNQSTGYSSSISSSYLPLRRLGAAARLGLLSAAAQRWNMPAASLRTHAGTVFDPANAARVATYADLLPQARALALPEDAPLRARSQWQTLGQRPTRVDTPSKVDGTAQFGIDIRMPGMLTGVVARAPALGATIDRIDARRALRLPGVKHVLRIPSGVAVLALDFWSAQRGRAALRVSWKHAANASSTAQQQQKLIETLGRLGTVGRHVGDPESLETAEGRWLRADYEAPFLAHAALEPLACTAWVQSGRCDVWVGTQAPSRAQNHAAEITGLSLDQVFVHTLQIGGAFGRRGEWDWVEEAVHAARQVTEPVKIVWSRDDDMHHDFYRPASAHRLSGRLHADGQLEFLTHRIATTSVARRRSPDLLQRGHDILITQGSHDMEYAVPHCRVDYHDVDLGVPVGFWRSVGHSHNGFVLESFIDELARFAGVDPLDFRLRLLTAEPRMREVLQRAARQANWGTPLAAGRGRGIACMKSYGTYVAQVAEVAVAEGSLSVEKVFCAVDSGAVVHPGIVEQQMHSGIVYALSAALGGEITFDAGAVQQSNFHDYPPLRIPQMPLIEVMIIESDAAPGGCGEPAAPVIAPAVCNAIFAATGQRLRRLPIKLQA